MNQEIRERIEKIRRGEVPEGYHSLKGKVLPLDWNLSMIKQIAKIFRGASPRPINDTKWFSDKSTIGWVRIADVSSANKILLKTSQYLSEDGIKKSRLVKKGHIIMSICASVGKPVYTGFDVCIHDGFVVYEDLRIVPDFFYYYLSFLEKNWYRYGQTGSQMNLNTSIVGIELLSIPNNPVEQQKVAEILSTWDKAIELKEKLIEEKKILRSAIVTDLLFGLKRFDEFIKSHKYNQTKYISIPEDWQFIKIGEIAIEVSEKNGDHDDLPVLSCTKYEGLVDSLSYFKRQVFSEDTSTYKQVKKNHFVYATNHIDEGSIGCQNLYENALVSPMYTVFKTNSKVNNHFLFNLLKTRLYIFIYQVNMSASVDRRGSLRWNEFSEIRIPLPDITEQDKIVEFIRLFDNNIELLKSELNQLKEQKRGLKQLLLTGIVRVEVN